MDENKYQYQYQLTRILLTTFVVPLPIPWAFFGGILEFFFIIMV
jgi:hypothetical protein